MIDITTSNMATMISYITGMIGDLMPLILVVLGVSLAFMVVDYLLPVDDDDFFNKE